jgi:predicted transposase YbfD/YdcC
MIAGEDHQLDWLTAIDPWKGLAGAVRIEATTTEKTTGKTTSECRYHITSYAPHSPERALALTRGHWPVESNLHWVLGVVFGEDRLRFRARRAAEYFGALRRLALSLLTAAPPPKKGMSIKPRHIATALTARTTYRPCLREHKATPCPGDLPDQIGSWPAHGTPQGVVVDISNERKEVGSSLVG